MSNDRSDNPSVARSWDAIVLGQLKIGKTTQKTFGVLLFCFFLLYMIMPKIEPISPNASSAFNDIADELDADRHEIKHRGVGRGHR